MVKNSKSIQITDPETGETFNLNADSLVSDTIGVLMSWRRNVIQSMVWEQLSEAQQAEAIGNAEALATDLVTSMVEIIATKGNDVIHALLDNFKIKDGTVTVTAKGIADNMALLALNSVGKKALKIVVADAEQFDQMGDRPEPTPDQGKLPMEDPGLSDEDVDDMASQMDDDLDAMDEPDDLHDEPSDPASDERVAGYHARMQGQHSQRNPYPIGDDERQEWYLGWKAADNEETAPEVEEWPPVKPSEFDDGSAARVAGKGKGENPFPGGSESYSEWLAGWTSADSEISELIEEGRKAALDGKTLRSCKWSKGSDGRRFWMEGFEKGKADLDADEDAGV